METQEVLLSFPNHSFRMFQESLAPDTAMCSAPGAPATRAASTTLVNDAAFHHLQITFSECNLRLLVSCTVKLWTFSAICCCQVAMNFFRVSRFCCTLGEWHASQRIWQTLNCIHGLIRVFPISCIQRAIGRKTNLEATLLLMISHLSINEWLICLKNATAREIPNHSSENQGTTCTTHSYSYMIPLETFCHASCANNFSLPSSTKEWILSFLGKARSHRYDPTKTWIAVISFSPNWNQSG